MLVTSDIEIYFSSVRAAKASPYLADRGMSVRARLFKVGEGRNKNNFNLPSLCIRRASRNGGKLYCTHYLHEL